MKNDFSQGSVVSNVLSLALPMTMAQLVNVLYNIVDRMYIGRLPQDSTLALTGIGLALPIITMVMAFANLFGTGGAPLCSIARGAGRIDEAEAIMGNSFCLLLVTGVAITLLGLLFQHPLLYLFGASDATYPFAGPYTSIYLCGSVFVMISLGMNGFINSQGFGRTGMMTVLLGAAANIVLDPIFIFVLGMGVRGAALATILSQLLSALWVLRFLTGPKAILHLRFSCMRLQAKRVREIMMLGLSGFTMAITNSAVQVFCNAGLQAYGGDLYVGVMTVINSVREIITMPINGLTNGAQPIMGYNYGAGYYSRIRQAIRFCSCACIIYTVIFWGVLYFFPAFFIHIFNDTPALVEAAIPALHIYFFGYFMMSLQFSGQAVFVALGKSRQAIFFSLLRKVVIVIPLTVLLPRLWGLGVTGVFLAEPISNFIGGTACFATMLLTVWPELSREESPV